MKEANCKGYILYNSNYMTFWGRQNYRDSIKFSGCQELRRGERNRWGTLMSAWNYSVCYCHHTYPSVIHLSKPMELATQRRNPNINHGLLLIVMYQHWLINCNKFSTPMQNVNDRGNWQLGWWGIWKSSVLSAWFSVNLNPI